MVLLSCKKELARFPALKTAGNAATHQFNHLLHADANNPKSKDFMLRNIQRSLYFIVAFFGTSSLIFANSMVTNTKAALDYIRHDVTKDTNTKKMLMKTVPSGLIKFSTTVFYDKQTCANASIARPFFVVKNADNCLGSIGSTDDDIAYLKSVFTEFYGNGERSMYRLVTILHRHMMVALGFPASKTLEQFRHMMEKTNKHGYPTHLDHTLFDTYCRCVARGLYAVYWFDHGLS